MYNPGNYGSTSQVQILYLKAGLGGVEGLHRPHWGWDFENGVPIGPLEVLKAFSEEISETALFRTRPLLDGAVATIGHILQPFDSEEANTPNETPLDNERTK